MSMGGESCIEEVEGMPFEWCDLYTSSARVRIPAVRRLCRLWDMLLHDMLQVDVFVSLCMFVRTSSLSYGLAEGCLSFMTPPVELLVSVVVAEGRMTLHCLRLVKQEHGRCGKRCANTVLLFCAAGRVYVGRCKSLIVPKNHSVDSSSSSSSSSGDQVSTVRKCTDHLNIHMNEENGNYISGQCR